MAFSDESNFGAKLEVGFVKGLVYEFLAALLLVFVYYYAVF